MSEELNAKKNNSEEKVEENKKEDNIKNTKPKKEAEKKSVSREILEWIVCIVTAFVLAVVIKYFIFTPTLVKQTSMFPTIEDNDRVFVNRLVRTFHLPLERGDIITLEAPMDNEETRKAVKEGSVEAQYYDREGFEWIIYNMVELGKTSYIKRVIGISGDHIKIDDGKVYLNGEELDESSYLPDGTITAIENGIVNEFTVPAGYIFAMGDNREGSRDCRSFGCVPIEKVEGKVLIRIWPLDRFGEIVKSKLTAEEAKEELAKLYKME